MKSTMNEKEGKYERHQLWRIKGFSVWQVTIFKREGKKERKKRKLEIESERSQVVRKGFSGKREKKKDEKRG